MILGNDNAMHEPYIPFSSRFLIKSFMFRNEDII